MVSSSTPYVPPHRRQGRRQWQTKQTDHQNPKPTPNMSQSRPHQQSSSTVVRGESEGTSVYSITTSSSATAAESSLSASASAFIPQQSTSKAGPFGNSLSHRFKSEDRRFFQRKQHPQSTLPQSPRNIPGPRAALNETAQSREWLKRTDDTSNTTTCEADVNHVTFKKVVQSLFTRIVCINLERRPDRWHSFQSRLEASLKPSENELKSSSCNRADWEIGVERFVAVDGVDIMDQYSDLRHEESYRSDEMLPTLEWDATKNAKYDRHIQHPMTKQMTAGEVGCAMSHVRLWKELVQMDSNQCRNDNKQAECGEDALQRKGSCATMLILEDDAIFYKPRRRHHRTPDYCGRQQQNQISHSFELRGKESVSLHTPFHNGKLSPHHSNQQSYEHSPWRSTVSTLAPGNFAQALVEVWKILPNDWDILYLGFSDRGERKFVSPERKTGCETDIQNSDLKMENGPSTSVALFRPTYGFHTHAYALSQHAASILLSHQPVRGPLDVWLADNEWFGLNVYCSVIPDGSGKHRQGAQLISQDRRNAKSNIRQSGRKSWREQLPDNSGPS